jgi:hypothetical protein
VADKELFRTPTVDNNLQPTWTADVGSHTVDISAALDAGYRSLDVGVWDEDVATAEPLGHVRLSLAAIAAASPEVTGNQGFKLVSRDATNAGTVSLHVTISSE